MGDFNNLFQKLAITIDKKIMQEKKEELTSKIKRIASNVDDYMIFINIHRIHININHVLIKCVNQIPKSCVFCLPFIIDTVKYNCKLKIERYHKNCIVKNEAKDL